MTLFLEESHLRSHVEVLAGKIGERNVYSRDSLKKSADYIRSVWRPLNLEVASETFSAGYVPCENLIVEISGRSKPEEIILLGAHYDSVKDSPGANDNASGVAALLEISRLFSGQNFSRTIRFAAFANEEAPFFGTPQMGGYVHAQAARQKKEKIKLMISIETIGYYSSQPGSQKYPPLLDKLYPPQGDFLGIVGNFTAPGLVSKVKKIFQEEGSIPVQSIAAPRFVPGVDWSDHAMFWDAGFPAIMLTDTAPYRYPHYHLATDTPDKLTYPAFTKAVSSLAKAAVRLANDA